MNDRWLPMIVGDPIPFAAAILARTSEVGFGIIFVTILFVAILLFEELADRADGLSDENNIDSVNISTALEEWRRIYDLACLFVESIDDCFGWMLLLQTAYGFAVPIFDFHKILYTNFQLSRHYFEFGHTIFRFFLFMLIPSYLVKQQVCQFNIVF